MRDNLEGERDSAFDDRRRCKKNYPFVLPSINRQKKAVTMAAKSGQFTAGKGQFL